MNKNDYDLIIRSLDGELPAEAQARLDELLQTSEDARKALEQHRSVRTLVAEHGASSFAPDFTDRVMDELPSPRTAPEPSSRASRADRPPAPPPSQSVAPDALIPWTRIGTALATLVVLIGIGLAFWLWPHTVHVPPGETELVALADGSVVELSAGSTLEYRSFWGRDERAVTLHGEAFFDVAEARNRPFIVETFNARVTVTGTRFNVRAWSDDPARETAVTLASGHVNVAPRADTTDTTAPLALSPGETSRVMADTTVTSTALSLDQALAWRSGGLAFVDRPLGSVLHALERRYDLSIRLADSDLADRPLTYLNPNPPSGEAALSDICHTLGLRYERTADGYRVRR